MKFKEGDIIVDRVDRYKLKILTAVDGSYDLDDNTHKTACDGVRKAFPEVVLENRRASNYPEYEED